jgi:uncharacterized protein (TIGR02246 family)
MTELTVRREQDMLRIFALVVVALAIAPCHALAQATEDERQIREVTAKWQEAWNQHDMTAGAQLFTEEADFVNVNGSLWKGRGAIERSHAELHAKIFKNSTFKTLKIDIRFLTQDVARAHVNWEIKGDTNLDGTARMPRQGIFTQILVKKDGEWLISAWHNTNIITPR